jgi:chitinase
MILLVFLCACAPAPKVPSGPTEYAPYYYTWAGASKGYAFGSLMDLMQKSGLLSVTLAFVVTQKGRCTPVTTTGDGDAIETVMSADIAGFRAAGGRIRVSFGGAKGAYLEGDEGCTTAKDLLSALSGFVERTGLSELDFDIEQAGATTDAVNQRRAQALFGLQLAHPEVQVSLTLPVRPRGPDGTPGGLTAAGLSVVKTTMDAGVRLAHLNLLTMNYGASFSPDGTMGDLLASALNETLGQVRALSPGLGDDQIWALLGATPMIGKNDVPGEVFGLTDAAALVRLAQENRLGLVSFWAIQRDQPCQAPDLAQCSEVDPSLFAFHDTFKVLQ